MGFFTRVRKRLISLRWSSSVRGELSVSLGHTVTSQPQQSNSDRKTRKQPEQNLKGKVSGRCYKQKMILWAEHLHQSQDDLLLRHKLIVSFRDQWVWMESYEKNQRKKSLLPPDIAEINLRTISKLELLFQNFFNPFKLECPLLCYSSVTEPLMCVTWSELHISCMYISRLSECCTQAFFLKSNSTCKFKTLFF